VLDPKSKKGKLVVMLNHLDQDLARFSKRVVKQATDMILDDLDDKVIKINQNRVRLLLRSSFINFPFIIEFKSEGHSKAIEPKRREERP